MSFKNDMDRRQNKRTFASALKKKTLEKEHIEFEAKLSKNLGKFKWKSRQLKFQQT